MSTNIRYIYTSVYTRKCRGKNYTPFSYHTYIDDDDDYVFSFLYMNMRVNTYIYILNDRSNRARIKNDRICRVQLIANKIYVENNHFIL